MIKNTSYFLTLVISFGLLLITMLLGGVTTARAESPVFDTNYKSVHHYMSMNVTDPSKTGPDFLYENQQNAQATLVTYESNDVGPTNTSYIQTIGSPLLSGIATGMFVLGLISFGWQKGKTQHSSLNLISH